MSSVTLESAVRRSGRVMQVESMFDVPPRERSKVVVQIPPELADVRQRTDWNVGLIVGPSGSGKSTVARELWPDQLAAPAWDNSESILDGFPKGLGVKDVTGLLTSVGFGSPPAWLRPYDVLSTGEQFRADVARRLGDAIVADSGAPTVVDEFTSTVDRQVAQIGSHAVAKTVRRRERQLVAVTCHFDVLDWLQPDWVYRPDTVDFEWRRLQRRPSIALDVRQVGRDAWPIFAPHHYLSPTLHVAARQVAAFVDGQPVGFCAWYRFPHPSARNIMVNNRTVVLPDWQGVGIGMALVDTVGAMLHEQGDRFRTTTVHPGFAAAMRRSPRWREDGRTNAPSKSAKPKRLVKQHSNPRKLATRVFEYVA